MKIFFAIGISLVLFILSNFDYDLGVFVLLMFVIAPYFINYILFKNKRIALSFLVYSATSLLVIASQFYTKIFPSPQTSFLDFDFINDRALVSYLPLISAIFFTFSVVAAMREFKRVRMTTSELR